MSQIVNIPNSKQSSESAEAFAQLPIVDMRPPRRGLDLLPQQRRQRNQLRNASWAYSTRRVPVGSSMRIAPLKGQPQVGDLVLARIDALGHHANLQLVNGRRRHLFVGDEIVVAYGNRYASSQFESFVPDSFGPCHLVAGGGIASRAVSWHRRVSRGPTHITPLGAVADRQGGPMNLRDFALAPATIATEFQPTTIAVVGTSMDSGKTQTCAHLVRGLIAAGLRVGYVKATGTGAGGDIWWLKDAGADPVLDFVDAGLPSTYLTPIVELEQALSRLITEVATSGVDAVIVEIADGVLQHETASLLSSPIFARSIGGILLAAGDAMGAAAAAMQLAQLPNPLLGITGVLTSAPLQVKEASDATGLDVFDRDQLATPDDALALIGAAQDYLVGASAPRKTGQT